MKHGHLNSEISRKGILQVVFANLFHNCLCCYLIRGTLANYSVREASRTHIALHTCFS